VRADEAVGVDPIRRCRCLRLLCAPTIYKFIYTRNALFGVFRVGRRHHAMRSNAASRKSASCTEQ
jgi:hypothetical protein